MEKYEDLAARIRACEKCPLHTTRRNAVPGEGPIPSQIMLIGEAPGEREDALGRPFVGSAGRLLEKLLREVGLKRGDVYITNLVKCRPPNNRDPKNDEIAKCLPYLLEEINIVKPQLIVTLGRHSTRVMLSLVGIRGESIMRIRGRVIGGDLRGTKINVLPTLHPAAALYRPPLRRLIEEDFRKIPLILGGKGSKITDFFHGKGEKGYEGP